ncbi:PaaI family thioesterase [Pseudomonas putida]|uniref:PaaI family thioesterase n=1 Tax=Pseudomonas putida TaxID=303 RepID=UPI00226EA931|nr:PaaI family thioesterase [Pseudomonas putida]WAB96215.1 PaaI family thioesterase [Pseudomonas putida]
MNDFNKHYKGTLEFDVSLVSESEAQGQALITDGIRNPFGTVHAGAMIWFADVVATTLALQGASPEKGMAGFPLAINLSANMLSNSSEGRLIATARFVKRGRKVSTIRTTVESDQGRLLLDMTTTHIPS